MSAGANTVLAERDGRIGRLRLNRPKALHALDLTMCETMLSALAAWVDDPAVELVLIDHLSSPDGDKKASRGFCAGGDIRMLAESGAGDGAEARAFFATEYRLNHRLFTYPKPLVAAMDGVTMGGGVGLALPCRFRIATENTRLAMPETGIGLLPDVGGGWYLSRLPGRIGQYLALTGAQLNGAECLALGLATHLLPASALPDVKAALANRPENVKLILTAASVEPGEAPILALQGDIDRLFASNRLERILAALDAEDGGFARATAVTLATKSPQAMKASLRLLLDGATMASFEDEMRQEYAVVSRVVQRRDFLEGVRAVIVDKDNAPRWVPATVDGVGDDLIDQLFAPLPAGEQWSPA